MYTRHFNLVRRPFSRVPSATGCVMYPGLTSCFERACDGIQECAGPILVVASSGCGKSTLLALLESQFSHALTVVTLNCASIDSRHELVQCLLFELGLPFQSENVGELRLKLIDHLKSPEHCPHGLLLLVDEAHNLPLDVLEELRMITNMVCGSQHQIRLVIAGGRPLEEKLGHPQLDSFSQRIGVRCYLQNMSRTETMFFTLAQLQMCGRDGREIFQPSALEKIFDITDGVPRLVSHLGDHTLKLAAQENRFQIDARLVKRAWLDLQQLPAAPDIEDFQAGGPEAGIIEFGSLEDSTSADHQTMESVDTDYESETSEEATPQQSDESVFGQLQNVDESAELNQGPELEPVDQTVPNESIVGDESVAMSSGVPTEDTLESLLQELSDINQEAPWPRTTSGDPETSEAPDSEPVQKPIVDPTVTQGFPFTEVPLPDELISKTHKAEEVDPEQTSDANTQQEIFVDPTVTQAFPFKEMQLPDELCSESTNDDSLSSPESSEIPPAIVEPALDSTETQPLPGPEAQIPKETNFTEPISETRQPPESDLASTISTEELFGGSFEEERVEDIQSATLADQNRVSSAMTAPEIADLRPATPASETQSFDDIAIPQMSRQQVDLQPEDPEPHQPAAHSQIDIIENVPEPREPSESKSGILRAEVTQQWSAPSEPRESTLDATSANVSAGPADDSDMLIVEQIPVTAPEPTPVETDPPGTQGQVIRMNYQDLFQQLRNQNPNSQT